jgi:DNA-binding transcriptional LysR family regulator
MDNVPKGVVMPAVNLRHIEIFHAVMTTGNLTEAATMLHTSQPTVSRELARLENVLGLKLFERSRGRLHPTVQGLRLFEEVQRSWYGLDRILNTAESLREFRQGELSVVCLPVFSQSFLPALLQPFLARFPDVSLQIVPQESPLLEEWLSAQRHDLGLTETLHTPAGTERTPLLCMNEVCVLPAAHPLVAKTVLTPQDFEGQNYISLSRTDSYRQLLDGLFTEHGVHRRMVVETHSAASICAMVRAGVGISVVNPFTALDYAWSGEESGLAIRRFSIEVPFTVSLIRPQHRPGSALVDAFIEHLQSSVQTLVTPLEEKLNRVRRA